MAIPVGQIKAGRADWKAMPDEDFERALYGIEKLTGGLVTFVADRYSVEMGQSPDIVLKALSAGSSAQSSNSDPKEGNG